MQYAINKSIFMKNFNLWNVQITLVLKGFFHLTQHTYVCMVHMLQPDLKSVTGFKTG